MRVAAPAKSLDREVEGESSGGGRGDPKQYRRVVAALVPGKMDKLVAHLNYKIYTLKTQETKMK